MKRTIIMVACIVGLFAASTAEVDPDSNLSLDEDESVTEVFGATDSFTDLADEFTMTEGMTTDPTSVMDYDSSEEKGAMVVEQDEAKKQRRLHVRNGRHLRELPGIDVDNDDEDN